MDDLAKEVHPWMWYTSPGAKCLVIGTFPTALRNRSFDFFYPNLRNLFWRILSEIARMELTMFSNDPAVQERKAILNQLGCAITDMGHIVYRNNQSSSDEKLIPKEYMDISGIINANRDIQKIILTSSSGPVSALRWFENYCAVNEIKFKAPKGKKPLYAICRIGGRDIRIAVLYSPSPRAANRIGFDELVSMYRSEIIF